MRVPAIHAGRLGTTFARCAKRLGVDARHKAGHDGGDFDGIFFSLQQSPRPAAHTGSRLMASGPKVCWDDMDWMRLMFTCRGRVQAKNTCSAMSSPVMGVAPA